MVCANNCDKKMRLLIEKKFKNVKHKVETPKPEQLLSTDDKTNLINRIKQQNNEDLTQIVKIILRTCPDGIEDIDNDKLQIKVDFLKYKDLDLINDYLSKTNTKSENNPNNNNENENSD